VPNSHSWAEALTIQPYTRCTTEPQYTGSVHLSKRLASKLNFVKYQIIYGENNAASASPNGWPVSSRYDLTTQNMNLEITKPTKPSFLTHEPTRTQATYVAGTTLQKTRYSALAALSFPCSSRSPSSTPQSCFPEQVPFCSLWGQSCFSLTVYRPNRP